MTIHTSDELNMDELQDIAGGVIHPDFVVDPSRKQRSNVGGLRLIQSWGPEIQTEVETRYPNPQK